MFDCFDRETQDVVSTFNCDLSKWNMGKVTSMSSMFSGTSFNGDISGWNVSSVTNMEGMFSNTPFAGDISGWDASSVTDMSSMFIDCPISEEHKPTGGASCFIPEYNKPATPRV
jgi:surface protein